MSRTERDNIEEALEHLEVLNSHIQRGNLSDSLILDAVCMRLFAAIEALSRLPEDRRQQLFGAEWNAMRSTRNRLAHAYLETSLAIITAPVERDVPAVLATLRSITESGDS
jgi:uncharacterized protein with HEPN domain